MIERKRERELESENDRSDWSNRMVLVTLE